MREEDDCSGADYKPIQPEMHILRLIFINPNVIPILFRNSISMLRQSYRSAGWLCT